MKNLQWPAFRRLGLWFFAVADFIGAMLEEVSRTWKAPNVWASGSFLLQREGNYPTVSRCIAADQVVEIARDATLYH